MTENKTLNSLVYIFEQTYKTKKDLLKYCYNYFTMENKASFKDWAGCNAGYFVE